MMHLKMNSLNRNLLIILSLFMCYCTVKAQPVTNISENLVLPAKTTTIAFFWQGDTINAKWEAHTAILLPVKLKNCSKLFFMQFDLGVPNSLFYKNKLAAIQAKYPKAIPPGKSDDKLTDFSFTIDKNQITAKQIEVKQFDSSGINWLDKNSVEIIGTIGMDLVDDKVVMIDYPNKTITISQVIAGKLKSKITLTDFMYVQKKILLPATIKNKQTVLYFDTGSSMFALLTDKKTAQSLAVTDSQVVQSKVKSWNKYVTANIIASNDSIDINGSKIAIRKVTFIDGISNTQTEQMMKMGIGGMTGNKLFLGYKLIIDTKIKKFGLLR